MNIDERVEAFARLGEKLKNLEESEIQALASAAKSQNGWFDVANVQRAIDGLVFMLQAEKLKKWINKYTLEPPVPRIVGVIMAGNIPMVGFHDLLSVLISGHFAAVKLSSQDTILMQELINWLVEIEPRFKRNIEIKTKLDAIDAVICTGSDNTARYFEYYFGKHPHIIRKNRTSVAVLSGSESEEDFQRLGDDIFSYYGLGCRNVSKLFVPEDFDPASVFSPLESFKEISYQHKYNNNYDYNKAIYLVNKEKHYDNGFLLMKESDDLVSPTAVLYFQRYKDEAELEAFLKSNGEKIQCIVGEGYIQFGNAQSPELWDYADGVDTLKFLESLD